ncbi:MAG: transketolase [Candidatus Thermoplasmatota archaeon]|nr:transketolase [Candidatus Thermoplasmatota archaeon]
MSLERFDYWTDIDDNAADLAGISTEARRWIIRMTHEAGSGHPGGSLSSIDILIALYFKVMRHDPSDPTWPDRDRLVMSKGHGAPALYTALSLAGYFVREELLTLRKLGSRLQGHPSMNKTPGIDMSTGSLGQGLSIALGIALGARLDRKDHRVYCILGDGEVQEGQVWEAAMAAAHYKADNLCAVLDRNNLQIDGPTEKIMSIEPALHKFESFGWNTIEINGHDFKDILKAFHDAETVKGRPTMIIANTVKGKGVSFMEGSVKFHGKTTTPEELERALSELGGDI